MYSCLASPDKQSTRVIAVLERLPRAGRFVSATKASLPTPHFVTSERAVHFSGDDKGLRVLDTGHGRELGDLQPGGSMEVRDKPGCSTGE